MSEKYYRYFGSFLEAQENWLNKMAKNGYRLICVKKLMYEFEKCKMNEYQYCVEFVGHKSKADVCDYQNFLEDIGYKVFSKNINLNYSIGKVRYRPWAENGARISTNSNTFNRELLIVEKKNDGNAFELHTTSADRADYYASLRNAWLWMSLFFALMAISFIFIGFAGTFIFGAFAIIFSVPFIIYQIKISKYKHNSEIEEIEEIENNIKKRNGISRKNFLIMLIVFAIIIAFAALNMNGITSFGSGFKIGFVENKSLNEWSASYYSFSGFTQRNVDTGDANNTIDIEIKTSSGEIGLEIRGLDDTVFYSGKNIPTSSFKVDVKGKVSIRIDVKGHRGGYSIKWD